MGRIIKNGVAYGGSSSKASSTTYDNSTSGLSATNVQGAVDELDNNLSEYIKIITVEFGNKSVGANEYTGFSLGIDTLIPNGYKPICAWCKYAGSSWWYNVNTYLSGVNQVTMLIKNTYGATDTGEPTAYVMCIKDI